MDNTENNSDDESVHQGNTMRRVVSTAEISVGGTNEPSGRDYKIRKSSLIGYVRFCFGLRLRSGYACVKNKRETIPP
jgi:hypothetical protein